MQIENDYDKEVYNRDIGYLDEVESSNQWATITAAVRAKCLDKMESSLGGAPTDVVLMRLPFRFRNQPGSPPACKEGRSTQW
jgi:hypothetical protein